MHSLFQKLFTTLRPRRGILFAVTALFAGICAWRAGGISLRESILDMLPAREKSVDDFTGIVSRFGYQNRLFFDIGAGGDAQKAAAAADELGDQFQKSGFFKNLIYRIKPQEGMAALDLMETHLPALFGPEEQEYALSAISAQKIRARLAQAKKTLLELPVTGPFARTIGGDPLGIGGIFLSKLSGFQYGARIEDGRIWSGDGKHIMLVAVPQDAAAQGPKGRELLAFIEKARKAAAGGHPGTQIRYIGGLRITEDNREMMRGDIALTTTLSTLFVLLLSFAAYRRALLVLLSMVPVAFGGLAALGGCAFATDQMSAIVAGFGGVLIGIAVDYAVYVLYRYDHFEGPFGDAEKLSRHLSAVTAPIVMGAATTMAAFLCLLLSSLPGQRQLGVFAAVGIGGAALFSLVVLPQLLSLSPPKRKKPLLDLAKGFGGFFEWHQRHPRLCLGFVLALSLAAGAGVSRVTFDGDLQKLSGMRPDTRLDDVAISQQWGGQFFNKTLIAVGGATLEQAQQKNDQLYSLLRELEGAGTIENFNSLSPLAPSLRTQRENGERWRAFWNQGNSALVKRRLKEAGQAQGFSPSAFLPFYRELHQKAGVFSVESLREGALGNLMGGFISQQNGQTFILTEVKAGSGYEALAGRVRERMPDALVYNGEAFAGRISALVVKVLWLFTWVSLAVSLAILLVGYGRLEIVAVIAAALGLDALWSLGLLGWLGIPINLMNNIFILFVFGMGADYAIYVASSFLGRYLDPREEPGVAGGAAALSALTGIGAFGTLVAARHPAMRSIGVTATIVLVTGLLVASVVLPLAMRVLLWKNGRHGTPTLRTLLCGLAFALFSGLALVFCRWGLLPWLRLRFRDDPARRRKAVQAFLRTSSRVLLNSIPYGKRLYLNAGAAAFAKPAFIVCNHQSVIDIPCALALPVNIRMVVKPRIWNSFFIGAVVREAGFILDEGTKAHEVFERAQEGLREGDFPLFFPEATLSESGSMGLFEGGAFEACVKAGAEILPVVMCETRSCVPPSAFWIGDHRLVVSVMPPIRAMGKKPGELAREAGILMAREYENNLTLACDGPEFFKRIRGRYRYFGPRVERAVGRLLRRDPLYRGITGLIPRDAVVLDLGGDDGLLANILAAESPRRSVIGFAPDEQRAALARKAAVAPERTTYEVREKMDGGEFPPADAVLLSLDGSSFGEALLLRAVGCLQTGGRLVWGGVSPAQRENGLRLLERSDFVEIKNFGNVIISEKRKAGPHGL